MVTASLKKNPDPQFVVNGGNELKPPRFMLLLMHEEEHMANFRTFADEPRRNIILEQESDRTDNSGVVLFSLLLLILAIGAAYFLWEGHTAEVNNNEAIAGARRSVQDSADAIGTAVNTPAAR